MDDADAGVLRVDALLITGTVGAGKTSVATAVGDLLAAAQVPNAVIDIDDIRRRWPTPPHDPFDLELSLRNLRAIAANYRETGVKRLVLAGVIENRHERDRHQEAVGSVLTVCRLRAELPTLHRRLRERHPRIAPVDHAELGLRWHMHRAGELDGILDAAAVADFTITTTELSVAEVATTILRRLHW